jgi:meiotically up-regulated gene 157 (Mug157) protein
MNFTIPSSIMTEAEKLETYYKQNFPKLAHVAKPCFLNTIETTVKRLDDGSYFIITGDIPAMWLRDSSAQLANYIPLAKNDLSVREILKSIIHVQFRDICIDPYANAYNESANGNTYGFTDLTDLNDLVWERKYEVDSLCGPILLLYNYWKDTDDSTVFTDEVLNGIRKIVEVFKCEQHHENSPYRFTRLKTRYIDTIHNDGKGAPVAYTGMTWSGFRPSDDACEYGYLVPSNMMAASALEKASEIMSKQYGCNDLLESITALRKDIISGIKNHAVIKGPDGDIYAYEVDGLGHTLLMDDANSPSLLAMPYYDYCSKDDELYQNTRKYILSKSNPYYFTGKFASGIGSPHTPKGYIWHIGVIMQALTSTDRDEILRCLDIIASTTGGTDFMHESFDPDNPAVFTRPWFAWANTLMAQLLEELMNNNFFENL